MEYENMFVCLLKIMRRIKRLYFKIICFLCEKIIFLLFGLEGWFEIKVLEMWNMSIEDRKKVW